MSTATYVTLADRGVLSVSGEDARTFLQGLISNDINKVTPERAIHAASPPRPRTRRAQDPDWPALAK